MQQENHPASDMHQAGNWMHQCRFEMAYYDWDKHKGHQLPLVPSFDQMPFAFQMSTQREIIFHLS